LPRLALSFLQPLVQNPNFLILKAKERHWSLLEDVLAGLPHPSSNLVFDVHTAVLTREQGIAKMYTIDTDFLEVSGIEVINPLRW
jgi:predicted nucleic acid-binding protein